MSLQFFSLTLTFSHSFTHFYWLFDDDDDDEEIKSTRKESKQKMKYAFNVVHQKTIAQIIII